MKTHYLIAAVLLAVSFFPTHDAGALTKYEQDYNTFNNLLKDNRGAASLVAVYDQLFPAVKVLNEGHYRVHAIFSINGEMKEPIKDIYVKSLVHLYPGQGEDIFGPYRKENVFGSENIGGFATKPYLDDKICINICLKDCSQSDLATKDNTYYPFIMTVLSAGDAMLFYGDSFVLKTFFEKSFGPQIAENWEEVEAGAKPLVITREMISRIPSGGKDVMKAIIADLQSSR